MKKIFTILMLLSVVLSLSACGKSAHPVPYPNSGYPHTYPHNQ